MNRGQLDGILNVIKNSSDKGVVVKGLVKLRTDLVKDPDGITQFRDAGGMAPMIRLLNKPHEKILEVVLSILANCCMDDICCKQALNSKIQLSLTVILQSIPNPVITNRACRLLGNLAKCQRTQLLSVNSSAIAKAVCKIIETTDDVGTRIMALRACRFLLPDNHFMKSFLQVNGFYNIIRIFAAVMKNDEASSTTRMTYKSNKDFSSKIGLKKYQHREKYFEEVARHLEGVRSDVFDQEVLKNSVLASNAYTLPKEAAAIELVNEIIKCLGAMSAMQIDFKVWETLARPSGTLAPLVYFATEDNIHRAHVLKILSNFSKNHGAFYILSLSDAIVAACELLVSANMTKPLTESERRYCINIICMLCTDACNRSKIRRSGALRKLIDILRQSHSYTERSMILYILNNFQFDNMSMDQLLREGLISLLIKELNDYLTSDNEYHKRKRDERLRNRKKRKLETDTTNSESLSKLAKTIFDIDSPTSSPSSTHSMNSPCSSRCMSPVGGNNFQNEDVNEDDENYSPACSDDDASDDEETATNVATLPEESEIMRLLDITTEPIDDKVSDRDDDDDNSQDLPHLKMIQIGFHLIRAPIDIIENLIFRVTLMINKRAELGKAEVFDTLIKAIHVFGASNNFNGSLTNILLESKFFAHIIRIGVAHKLYQLSKVDEMRCDAFGFLETLTNVAESNYGKAELVRLLRSGDINLQRRAAITVAHIIKNRSLLYQFLNDGNALTLLFEMILQNSMDVYSEEAADAILNMSRHTLCISLPILVPNESHFDCSEMIMKFDDAPLQYECDMRFIVSSSDGVDSAPTDTDASSDCDNGKPSTRTCELVVIEFNKQLLCESSDVFNTMLNSDFREGRNGEVELQQHTASGVSYFLNLIVRLSEDRKINFPPERNYKSLLEAFELSRIYMLTDMEALLQQLLVKLLEPDSCLQLFEWALKNYHTDLTKTAINYYLSAKLSSEAKVALFREADRSTFSSEWFQLMNDTVYERAQNVI